MRAGAGQLLKLTGGKIKEKIIEQATPENIAKAAMVVGKVAIKSAPALAAGPAAFGAAVMANGGKEIAHGVAAKAKEELSNPETQKKILVGGAKLAKQAFSKPAEATPAA
jgi:hypothetical protein